MNSAAKTFTKTQDGITYTDTVNADGRVEWSEVGYCREQREYVDRNGIRHTGRAMDLGVVARARAVTGWDEVAP